MPKLEAKIIQKELDQGLLWPVYWFYGGERMKARELLRRVKRAAHGDAGAPLAGFAEEALDATEADAATILDAAQSQALGGGLRVIVVREAHALKNAEVLEPLLGPRAEAASLTSVCVFLSKDLDARKKFSKALLDKAAVVPCEDVPESERETWIQYLAKRRELCLPQELISRLAAVDPWSLDIIEQELEKYSLYCVGQPSWPSIERVGQPSWPSTSEGGQGASGGEVLLGAAAESGGGEVFMSAFFMREFNKSMRAVESFADQPDESLPLLGLLAWNVRHLALIVAAREKKGAAGVKLNPYVAGRLQAWSRHWSLADIVELQEWLADLDFSFKQRPLVPLGLWTSLVIRFCTQRG